MKVRRIFISIILKKKMTNIESKILNALLDLYEKSKTFSGENKIQQVFKVSISKLFPKYDDNAEYDFFADVNEKLSQLEQKNFISLQKEKSGKIKSATLNAAEDVLQKIYKNLNRANRKEFQKTLLRVLDFYSDPSDKDSPLQKFILEQKAKIVQNKNVEHFNKETQNFDEFDCILKATRAVLQNEEEIFVRDFSIRLFNDSKKFEKIQSSVISILTQYGDYDDKENILVEYNIIKTPTYVCVKGNGIITLNTQIINLSLLNGDIAFSTQTLKEITKIVILGNRIVTVENLTSFHDYKNSDDFVIYLGGFHNRVKRDFIRMIYEQNKQKKYMHFGDIDIGGFYILNHLKKKTKIEFEPLFMDIATLKKYSAQTKTLTAKEKNRLKQMSVQCDFFPFKEILLYMQEQNCKLEQESITAASRV